MHCCVYLYPEITMFCVSSFFRGIILDCCRTRLTCYKIWFGYFSSFMCTIRDVSHWDDKITLKMRKNSQKGKYTFPEWNFPLSFDTLRHFERESLRLPSYFVRPSLEMSRVFAHRDKKTFHSVTSGDCSSDISNLSSDAIGHFYLDR